MRNKNGNDMEDTNQYKKSGVHHALLGLEDLVSVILPGRLEAIHVILGMVN